MSANSPAISFWLFRKLSGDRRRRSSTAMTEPSAMAISAS
jgi:hypothetical protein